MVDFGSIVDKTKEWAMHTGIAYMSFALPLAVFFAFNSAADTMTRDQEKYGALWVQYNRLSPEERERTFPEERPGSAAAAAAHDLA
jgi:hypothetical protein